MDGMELVVLDYDESGNEVVGFVESRAARCLNEHLNDCEGAVEYRDALSPTGIRYPRCDKHWAERLAVQEELDRRYPQQAPADFDPLYAGESWDED